jgi:hypothetical protein
LPDEAKSIAIVEDKELLITDERLGPGVGSNQAAGALSFARATKALGLAGGAAQGVSGFMQAWSQALRNEGDDGRATKLDAQVICPWLRRTSANGCDSTCAVCKARELSLESAPLRLIAVVNRTDLSVMPDRAGAGGEGRLVFAVTDGPGDDVGAAALPITVIYEYAQHGPATEWAKRWHALGGVNDAAYAAALTTVTDVFVANGALAQVRTADAWTGPMRLHQFEVIDGSLKLTPVRNSPDWAHLATTEVSHYVSRNASAIDDGTYLLPKDWWAMSSSLGNVVPKDRPIPRADLLSKGTCGGCHAQTPAGFQIDPLAQGRARISTFLRTESHDANDELSRRTAWTQLTLAGMH